VKEGFLVLFFCSMCKFLRADLDANNGLSVQKNNTVTIRKPDQPVFNWLFSGPVLERSLTILCPVRFSNRPLSWTVLYKRILFIYINGLS
jgi:hypothetical protein